MMNNEDTQNILVHYYDQEAEGNTDIDTADHDEGNPEEIVLASQPGWVKLRLRLSFSIPG